MPSPTDPPESPPAGPVIPIGFSTRVAQVVGAIFGLIALVTAVLDGDHSEETITALILAAVTVVTMLAGRYAQAVAAYLADFFQVDDASGEPDVPSDEELKARYPGSPPPQDPPSAAGVGEWREGDPIAPPGLTDPPRDPAA